MVDVLEEKVAQARKALRLAAEMSRTYYGDKLVLTYSGGKDSDVMLHLALSCLTADDFEVINSHTGIDAPPTVKHIRNTFEKLNKAGIKATIHIPRYPDGKQISIRSLIVKNVYPPTRTARYCCKYLKETSVSNRLCALGVRKAESSKRQGRDIFATRGMQGGQQKLERAKFFSLDHAEEVHRESQEINDPVWDCTMIKTMKEHGDMLVNPIYEWSDSDIWQYINSRNVTVNPLYYPPYNYKRVGCVLCPMAGYNEKKKQVSDFPGFKRMYIAAFDAMLEERKRRGLENRQGWENGTEVFNWWTEEYKHNVKGQMDIFDFQ